MSPKEIPYVNISCDLYDKIEAYSTQGVRLNIKIRTKSEDQVTTISKIYDLQTRNKEEFALLENDEWVRLDRIVSLTPQID